MKNYWYRLPFVFFDFVTTLQTNESSMIDTIDGSTQMPFVLRHIATTDSDGKPLENGRR